MNKAIASASDATKQIMLIEAQGKVTTAVMMKVKEPVFIQLDWLRIYFLLMKQDEQEILFMRAGTLEALHFLSISHYFES